MPLGAETVGTAFVRVLVDGDELPQGIRDQLKESEKDYTAFGRRHSQAYADAMEEEFSGPSGRRMTQALTEAVARGDLTDAFFEGDNWKKFEKSLKYRFGISGEVAAKQMVLEFKKHGRLEGLESAIEDITPRIVKATEDIHRETEKAFKETEQAAADFEKEWRRELDAIDKDAKRLSLNIERDFDHIDKTIDQTTHTIVLSAQERVKAYDGEIKAVERVVAANKRMSKSTRDSSVDVDHQTNVLRKSARMLDTVGGTMARLFGKGARNNFLNLLGRIIALPVTIISGALNGLGIVADAAKNFFSSFSRDASSAESAAVRFTTAMGAESLAGAFGNLATGGAAAAVGLGLLALALGVAAASAGAMISALVLLSGVLIALASTVSFAVVAAFAALAPVLLPIAGIIAGIVAMVFRFNSATGALKRSMDSVRKTAKGLFATFNERAFKGTDRQVSLINRALTRTKPLVAAAGDGFRGFLNEILKGTTHPAFKAFIDDFAKFLPDAMTKLGSIFSQTFAGIGGILRAAIPTAESFLTTLDNLTARFAAFTNSTEGQGAIKSFFDDAKASAISLGEFIKQLGGLVGDLLGAGRQAGNNIFDSMANGLERVRAFFDNNPDALRNFFRDSQEFARQLGESIRGIADAIDTLDTPQNRKIATEVFGGIGDAAKLAARAIALMSLEASYVAEGFVLMARISLQAVAGLVDGVRILVQGMLDDLASITIDIPGFPSFDDAAESFRRGSADVSESLHAIIDDLDGVDSKIDEFQRHVNNALHPDAKKTPITPDVNTGPALKSFADIVIEAATTQKRIEALKTLFKIDGSPAKTSMSEVKRAAGLLNAYFTSLNPALDINTKPAEAKIHSMYDLIAGLVAAVNNVAGGAADAVVNRTPSIPTGNPNNPNATRSFVPRQGVAPRQGKTVDASGWTIVTPGTDARAVATEVLNRMAAASY